MSVENAKVHDLVQYALDHHPRGNVLDRVLDAFYDVNAQRSGHCDDLNLTAADHYLISRYVIVKCSPAVATVYSAMVTTYDGLYKGVNELVKAASGKDIVFRTGKCPAANFSPLVIAWAFTGISDGSLDCVSTKWMSSPKLAVPKIPIGFAHTLTEKIFG